MLFIHFYQAHVNRNHFSFVWWPIASNVNAQAFYVQYSRSFKNTIIMRRLYCRLAAIPAAIVFALCVLHIFIAPVEDRPKLSSTRKVAKFDYADLLLANVS